MRPRTQRRCQLRQARSVRGDQPVSGPAASVPAAAGGSEPGLDRRFGQGQFHGGFRRVKAEQKRHKAQIDVLLRADALDLLQFLLGQDVGMTAHHHAVDTDAMHRKLFDDRLQMCRGGDDTYSVNRAADRPRVTIEHGDDAKLTGSEGLDELHVGARQIAQTDHDDVLARNLLARGRLPISIGNPCKRSDSDQAGSQYQAMNHRRRTGNAFETRKGEKDDARHQFAHQHRFGDVDGVAGGEISRLARCRGALPVAEKYPGIPSRRLKNEKATNENSNETRQ